MPWNAEERRLGVRAVAVQRLVAVPVFLVVCLLQDEAQVVTLLVLGTGMLAYEAVGLAILFGPRWQRAPLPALLCLDCVAIAAAVALSGGGESDARYLALLVVVSTAICLPRTTLLRLALLLIALVSLPVVLDQGEEPVLGFFAAAALATLLAANLARVGEESTARLHALAAERRTLLAQALDAEQGTRRLLAQDVHDRVLQTLLAARQDLEEAEEGAPGALALGRRGVDDAVSAVRDAVHELHVGALAGHLGHALHALVDHSTAGGAIEGRARIEAAPTRHDELLYAVARELVADARHRPGATRLELGLWREGDDVVLEVADDGAVAAAPGGRRLGLATSAERLAEAGGSLLARAPASGGNAVRARLPAAQADPAGA